MRGSWPFRLGALLLVAGAARLAFIHLRDDFISGDVDPAELVLLRTS